MNEEINQGLALSRARLGLDKRGRDSRAPLLQQAMTERVQLALEGGRSVQAATAGAKTVDWRSSLRTLYSMDTLNAGVNAGDDNWTSRVWRQHADLGLLYNSLTYANAAARIGAAGLVAGDVGRIALQSDTFDFYRLTATTPTWAKVDASRPFIEMGINRYGGFDWFRPSLLFDAGYGPVKATFPGGGVSHYIQQTTTTLQLLDAAGAVKKQASVITEWQLDVDPTFPETTDERKEHSDFTFDSNGPVDDFFAVKVSLALRDSPTWIDALNNTYFFRLDWITGKVE